MTQKTRSAKNSPLDLGAARNDLVAAVALMIGYIEQQIASFLPATLESDMEKEQLIINHYKQLRKLNQEVTQRYVRLIRSKIDRDMMRFLIATQRISYGLERISFLLVQVVHDSRKTDFSYNPTIKNSLRHIEEMLSLLFQKIILSYAFIDNEQLQQIKSDCGDFHKIVQSFFREILTYLLEDSKLISSAMHIFMMLKNLDMIADFCVDIADALEYRHAVTKSG